MAVSAMCKPDSMVDDEPLTWSESCALGDCPACPEAVLNVPVDRLESNVTYSQWTHGWKKKPKKAAEKNKEVVPESESVNVTGEGEESTKPKRGREKNKPSVDTASMKKVFGLFSITEKLSVLIDKYKNMLPTLKRHIYTAHVQWNNHASSRTAMSDTSIITVEDYQQNLEVIYIENPTSMAYSSNKLTVAVYPIHVLST